MHALHLRLPKGFVLEERLARYADAIETSPSQFAGLWATACKPLDGSVSSAFREVHLDLGCGKGAFLVEAARRNPDVLFLGIDNEPVCIAYAAQAVCEAGLKNAVLIPGTAERLEVFFAPAELSRIYINFPTPHPKRRHATLRLTHVAQLATLRRFLAPEAKIIFKTDSTPLWLYSRPQFEMAGYDICWISDDVRRDHPGDPETGYEQRLTAQGAHVHGICAVASRKPIPHTDELALAEKAVSQSLVDYLPDDLNTMNYVPHGMEATVINLRNLKAKQQH
ncbi:tRNA (guanosine(46)-N7)-methyltransferase TrmB [Olegusella massiliensis]|uniref:tRNA (guanosine(46)-N7)-methyltransferase TrmB n=1 Tax=Olegusella massiliensis TaxID=1776381 RepID=UPI0040556A8C